MKRNEPHVEATLAVRLASVTGAAAFSAVVLGTLVAAMAPVGHDAAFAAATSVTISPARIEVVGTRGTATLHSAASPHVG